MSRDKNSKVKVFSFSIATLTETPQRPELALHCVTDIVVFHDIELRHVIILIDDRTVRVKYRIQNKLGVFDNTVDL